MDNQVIKSVAPV